jgi:hypothetical protein
MVNHPNRSQSQNEIHGPDPTKGERAVVVTTKHRGVFFGYAVDTSGAIIKLRRMRNCLRWPTGNQGFVGLASMGPVDGACIGPPADAELRDITCVLECSAAATERWEKVQWAR